MVRPFGKECLINLDQINYFHPTIKFTAVEWLDSFLSLLDVRVSLNQGLIITDLFEKPMDTHQYLHQKSCHPSHCKSSIPCSQALRLSQICLDNTTFLERTKEFKHHLVKLGYRGSVVQEQIDPASCSVNRNTTLTPVSMKTHIEFQWS